MFRPKTLFIIGAGAGKEIGLPIGAELSNRIAQKLNFTLDPLGQVTAGDLTIKRVLQEKANYENVAVGELYSAGRQIAHGINYSRSIDEFINKHKENELIQFCSKVAIARAIVESERGSAIFVRKGESGFQRQIELDNSWLLEFVRILQDGLAKTDISKLFTGIKIITFNYDRSLEHTLFLTLQYSYGVSTAEAARALSNMPIIHSYGSLGKLPWQASKSGLPFGGVESTDRNLPNVAERIRTFYEQLQDDGEMNEIKNAVAEAERIVFLGFGFHQQNVRMLRPILGTGQSTNVRRVYATAYGESDAATEAIKEEIQAQMGNQIIAATKQIYVHNSMTCAALLKEYSRDLSAR